MEDGLNWQIINNRLQSMAWKKEHAESRRLKAASGPEYRAKRNLQSAKDKEARAEYMKAYYAANPGKFKRTPEQQAAINARKREKYAQDAQMRECARAAAKAWQQGNPTKLKAQRLKQYGIEVSDFNDLMTIQNGACAICGHSDTSKPNFFPVLDHCHTTGKIRGLLCMACNMGLGKFKDDTNRLFSAIAYLTKHG